MRFSGRWRLSDFDLQAISPMHNGGRSGGTGGAPQVTRSYPGRLKDARKAMEKDAQKLAKDGYVLAAEA